MPKTLSILDNESWKENYGKLLELLAEHQNIRGTEIGRAIHRLGDATGRERLGDWSRIKSGKRIPTQLLLGEIAAALHVPYNILRLSTGYVDETIAFCYSVAMRPEIPEWAHPIPPRRAALGLLFSLFPNDEMHIDNRLSLRGILLGSVLRLNVVDEGGYRTGEHWNSTWLYPEIFKPEHLIVMKSRGVTLLPGQKRKAAYLAPLTVIRAEAQIDAASDIAQTILSSEPATIPKQCMLYEAVHVLHASSLNLSMRLDHARDIVHAWANELDSKTAGEVREHLQQWVQRSLTVEAARWIKRGSKGEPPEHFWW